MFKHARDFGNDLTIMPTASEVCRPCNEAWVTAVEPLLKQRRIHFHIRGDLGFLRQDRRCQTR